jgi:site-specific DNA-methyltransferase (adenine-specific)/modification methylase
MPNSLILGDCLALLPTLPDSSVNLILTDLPYSQTNNSWDTPLPLDFLFAQYRRLLRPKGAIVLTSQGMFSAKLMLAAPDLYRYSLVWSKKRATGHLNAKRMPLRAHEDILVFYPEQPTYHAIRTKSPYPNRGKVVRTEKHSKNWGSQPNGKGSTWIDDGYRQPTSILNFPPPACCKSQHPTQKPVELGEWLIQSYTDPGAVVLDHCAGSGSFLVAAQNTQRQFLGIELDPTYYQTAKARLHL